MGRLERHPLEISGRQLQAHGPEIESTLQQGTKRLRIEQSVAAAISE
jgi:hypothetical protein